MTQSPKVSELTRILIAIGLLGLLLVGCFWVLRPFLPGLLWGSMIVVASWPLMLRLQTLLGGRRMLAVAGMTTGLVLCVVLPLLMSVMTLINNAGELVDWVSTLREGGLSTPPDWLRGLPFVGETLSREWSNWLAGGKLNASIGAHGKELTTWFIAQAGSVGAVLMHFAITVVIAALLYARGEEAARFVRNLAMHLADTRGVALIDLAGKSVRAVALGIVVTAVVQTMVGGLGLLIAGVPLAGPLISLMLILCIAQLGPTLILGPAVVWLFWNDMIWQGVVLSVLGVIAISLDNVLRPVLIQRGANLPLLLILIGVIGGLLGFGLVGLFIGPVILALGYTLVMAWTNDRLPVQQAALPEAP
ncbi:MAG: AI-2E family transporter YdiK [Rhodocyclaceae bacterium]